MCIKKLLILFCLCFAPLFYSARSSDNYSVTQPLIVVDSLEIRSFSNEVVFTGSDKNPIPLLKLFHDKEKKNKKLIAAILAFPLPFGIVGLHRIYLGCAPYVPVVYIASFGGILGLLPLIDFCFILLEKKTDPFMNNKKVFMWVK